MGISLINAVISCLNHFQWAIQFIISGHRKLAMYEIHNARRGVTAFKNNTWFPPVVLRFLKNEIN